MERIFLRNRQRDGMQKSREQYRIGVTGLGQGVGTTFVATALAFYFRDQQREVSYTECLNPAACGSLFFDQTAMDRRFAHRQFYDVYQLLTEGAPIKGMDNREEDIVWRVATPDDCANGRSLTEQQRGRLLSTAREDVCIFDMAADYQWDNFLMDMDVVFVVVDPLPSRMLRGRKRFQLLRKMEFSGCKIIWIVNHVNDGVHKKQVKSYLKAESVLWLDQMETAQIYRDEFLCQFHWENEGIRRKMIEIFTKVSQFERSLSWFSISNHVEI